MANDRLREARAFSNGLPGFWPWLKADHQMTVKVDGTVDGTFRTTVAKLKKNNHGS